MVTMFVVSVMLIFISDNWFFPVNTLFDKVCSHWLFCPLCWWALLSMLVPPAMMMMLATAGCAWWGCLPLLVLRAVVMGFVATTHSIDSFDEVCSAVNCADKVCSHHLTKCATTVHSAGCADKVCGHCSFCRPCRQSVRPLFFLLIMLFVVTIHYWHLMWAKFCFVLADAFCWLVVFAINYFDMAGGYCFVADPRNNWKFVVSPAKC